MADPVKRSEPVELLDRERELDSVQGLLTRAADARGRALLVEGEPGIGKTRLCEAAVALARGSGFTVLAARGRALEREFAFGAVRQLFEPALMEREQSAVDELLGGPAAPARPVFGLGPGHSAGTDPPGAAQHGLYRLSLNLAASRPLLVAVDDAHWCDAPSLSWLSYLAARLSGAPIAVLLTSRAPVGADRLPELAAIVQEPVAGTVSPGPLSETATTELAARVLGRPVAAEFARACRLASGGNPFLLLALLAALHDESVEPIRSNASRVPEVTPQQVSERLLQSLAGLPHVAGLLARAVSAVERPDVALAAYLADLDAADASEAADLLADAAILAPGRPLEFRHPLIRAAVYASMRPAERDRAHRRAARWLADSGADAEDVAAQLTRVEPREDAWVVDRLVEAADLARRRGAPEVAATRLERALREPPSRDLRPAVMRELGSAELDAGLPAAAERLREALDLYSDVPTRAALTEELARALTMTGRPSEAIAVLDAGAEEASATEREISLRLRAAQWSAAASLIHTDARRAALAKLAPLRELTGDTPAERFLLAAMAFQAFSEAQPAEEAVALARRAMADGRLLDELTADAPFLYACVMVPVLTDRFELADEWVEAALADANRRGSRIGESFALAWRAELDYRRGRLEQAERHARRSVELARTYGLAGAEPVPLACLLEVLIEQGRVSDGEAVLSDLGLAEETESPYLHFRFLIGSRGHLRIAAGRRQEGLADLRACGEQLDAHDFRTPAHMPWRSRMAVALAALGEHEEALRVSEAEVDLARTQGAPRALALALRVAGTLRRGDEGLAALREAVALLEGSPAVLERAHALVELGAGLRRAGHRRDAQEPLRLGLDLAARCGAKPLATHAREELVASGAKPRRDALTGPAALTASERRVATLAAQGLSNKEIALRLSVTVRTVELHLTHSYAKLRIGSRRDLRRALAPE